MERLPPKRVQEARLHDDRKALSAMGERGTAVRAENKRLREEEQTRRVEEAARERARRGEEAAREQERLYRVSEDGDVLPPDPNATAGLN